MAFFRRLCRAIFDPAFTSSDFGTVIFFTEQCRQLVQQRGFVALDNMIDESGF
jgi:hypothetical protein